MIAAAPSRKEAGFRAGQVEIAERRLDRTNANRLSQPSASDVVSWPLAASDSFSDNGHRFGFNVVDRFDPVGFRDAAGRHH